MSAIDTTLEAAVHAFQSGHLGEAEDLLQQVLRAEPDQPDALHLLGLIAVQAGELEAAADIMTRAFKKADHHPAIAVNLAAVLCRSGRFAEAEQTSRTALEKAPQDPGVWNGLGLALQGNGDGASAQAAFAKAHELAPDFREAALNLAAARYRKGDAVGAAGLYEEILKKAADDEAAALGLGLAQAAGGETEAAIETFHNAVVAHPECVEAYFNLASAGAMTDDEQAAAEALRQEVSTTNEDKARLSFALGEHVTDADPDAAFAYFEAGNALRKAQWAAQGRVFKGDANERFVDDVINTFTPDWFAARKAAGAETERPVFIVGMPRSGSTLLERMMAGHGDVAAGGELGLRVPLEGFPASMNHATPVVLDALASTYDDALSAVSASAARVTDKTPFNALVLGVLAAAMPRARIVHIHRDPRGMGLSCFMQDFLEPHVWACDLGDIARYRRGHDRLMAHWRAVMPVDILDVAYEDLVENPEDQMRRVLDYVGLPWDSACLDPRHAEGGVRTASVWAVRRPLGTDALSRWRRFESHLKPLDVALV